MNIWRSISEEYRRASSCSFNISSAAFVIWFEIYSRTFLKFDYHQARPRSLLAFKKSSCILRSQRNWRKRRNLRKLTWRLSSILIFSKFIKPDIISHRVNALSEIAALGLVDSICLIMSFKQLEISSTILAVDEESKSTSFPTTASINVLTPRKMLMDQLRVAWGGWWYFSVKWLSGESTIRIKSRFSQKINGYIWIILYR